MTNETHNSVVLLPGYWLGGWAWDAIADHLRAADRDVITVTLPGLDSLETDRRGICLDDHINAVINSVREHSEQRSVIVAHSGAGATGVIDVIPERVSRVIYTDSGPAAHSAVARPDLNPEVVEISLPTWEDFRQTGVSLDGLDAAMLERFQRRAIPHPAGPARTPLVLTNSNRYKVPSTIICSSFPAAQVRQLAQSGHPMFAEVTRFNDVSYIDVPTGHWPMWSRPAELAAAILEAIS